MSCRLLKCLATCLSDKEPLPTNYPRYVITWKELIANLDELGLELMLKSKFKPDYNVSYTDETGWAKIIPYLVFPADMYVAEDADCDDYAKAASAKAAMEFKRNGCFQCWGTVDNEQAKGRHAFNLVITGVKSFKLFDPNSGFPYAGKLFGQGEYGYIARAWK